MLKYKKIPYDQKTINSSIEILSYEEMVSILAFLYRTQQSEIERNESMVRSFMERFNTKNNMSIFDWRQELFVIPPRIN